MNDSNNEEKSAVAFNVLDSERQNGPCPECGFVRYRPDKEYHDYGCSLAPDSERQSVDAPTHRCNGVNGAERHGTQNKCTVCGEYREGYYDSNGMEVIPPTPATRYCHLKAPAERTANAPTLCGREDPGLYAYAVVGQEDIAQLRAATVYPLCPDCDKAQGASQ
jgi:ssDNA-binding Zn-finger/Zn-ribbon topoisomerase 1